MLNLTKQQGGNTIVKINNKQIQNNDLYFARIHPNAKIPCKNEEDSGYDVYPCFDEDYILIGPHEVKMIPTGLASAFSSSYQVVFKERGSTGTKNFGQRAGVVDSGYRGEWMVPITNHNNDKSILITKHPENTDLISDMIVYPYDKAICQAIVLPVPKMNKKEIPYDELKQFDSIRKDGRLGSSGK